MKRAKSQKLNANSLHKLYLGLGTNLGDREAHIRKAVSLIGERVGKVLRLSSLIETEPWGFDSPNKFLNAVLLCETTKTPREVLLLTQQIERDMGRTQKSQAISDWPLAVGSKPKANSQQPTAKSQRPTYKDRPIDIDILRYDDITVDEPDLKIPHPLMLERDFVMIPYKEITDT